MNGTYFVVGILCILFLYTVPVPIYPHPQPVLGQGVANFLNNQPVTCNSNPMLTISQMDHSIDDPVIMGGFSACSTVIGGPAYDMYRGLFYLGWIIGGLCLFYGVSK
jgi:hypothetical protein